MKKFRDGAIFGLGFSLTCCLVAVAFIFSPELLDKFTVETEDYDVKLDKFNEVGVSHRFLPYTDHSNGGLYISGELEIPDNRYTFVEVHAVIRNSMGGFIETCEAYTKRVVNDDESLRSFTLHCARVAQESELGTYTLELYGSVGFPYRR